MIGSKAARRRIRHAGVYLVLISLSTVFMMPLIWLIRSSFMSIIQIFRMPPEWIPRPFLLENYKTALTVLPFGHYALNTMLLVVNGVAGVVITSSFCAYSFARLRWKGRRLFFGLIMSGMMLPYAVTLIPTFLGWRYLVGSDSFLPLMIPAWFGGGAFNIFLLRQFMLGIPRELEDAAIIDSARYDQIFMRIIIPLTKPALIVVGLFCFFHHLERLPRPPYLPERRQPLHPCPGTHPVHRLLQRSVASAHGGLGGGGDSAHPALLHRAALSGSGHYPHRAEGIDHTSSALHIGIPKIIITLEMNPGNEHGK